jgi:hypothetical protein
MPLAPCDPLTLLLRRSSFLLALELAAGGCVSVPVWIIGAPLVYLVFDWMTSSKSTTAMAGRR